MAKSKRISYKGIPAEYRRRIAKIRSTTHIPGVQDTPAEIYATMLRDELELAARNAQKMDCSRKQTKDRLLEEIKSAFNQLQSAHDVAISIETELDAPYDPFDQARFARLLIEEAGASMEQVLCDLGLIEESRSSYFQDRRGGKLTRRWTPETAL